jgi:ketosteroid isomerase-like protein
VRWLSMTRHFNSNDATTAVALYTEDAVLKTPNGTFNGRQAIQKHFADLFQKLHLSDHVITIDADSPHIIGTDGKEMWATGGWGTTIKGENFGPTQFKGYWGEVYVREGDDWKIRMDTHNTTPAPAATPSPTTTPSSR